jgi:type IV pilus assembly protein PilA
MIHKEKEMIILKKAFTLVELLAVIVVLGIILAVAIPSITSTLNTSKDKLNDIAVKQIKDAAKDYVLQYKYKIDNIDTTGGYITVGDLIDSGIIESAEDFNRGDVIKITKLSNGDYQYAFPYTE